MPRKLTITIYTPYGELYRGEAEYLLFTTPEGDKGIRPGHENAILSVIKGEVRITNGRKRLDYTARDGILYFENDNATLITEFAALSKEYEHRHREHLEQLEQRYSAELKSEAELQRTQMALHHSLIQ